MHNIIKMNPLQLTAKARFSFFNFNLRLKLGATIRIITGLSPLIVYFNGHKLKT